MNASIVDLRYKTAQILDALEKSEKVQILYHGKVKGIILPVRDRKKQKVSEHPFFGMTSRRKEPVKKVMGRLRSGRVNDL